MTPRVKWMTAQYPLGRKVKTLKEPVAAEGFVSILGTSGRVNASRRQKGRECQLIEADQPHSNVLHTNASLLRRGQQPQMAKSIAQCVFK